jgi:membrane protein implicated in regulation of membrane protease activity
MSNDERRSRSFHASTILLWSAAVILAIAGMAFDARGSLTISVICFLAASVALVAPLVTRRRREAGRSEPADP